MFDDPQLYLFSLIIFSAIYWVIPWKKARLSFLLGVSLLLVFVFYPQALPVALAMTVFTWWGANKVGQGKIKSVWWIIVPLVGMFVSSRLISQNSTLIVDAGLTFLLLKSTGAVFEAKKKQHVYTLKNLMLLNFLFPIYPSGPIELASTVNEDKFADALSLQDLGQACFRIVIGLVKVIFIVDLVIKGYLTSILDGAGIADLSTADSWVYTYLKFLTVYLNFSGVIDIAIGTGMFFGIRLTENFNFPLVATNIQEFWKRWHMSLGRWINRYLFNILVRNTGKVVFSLMITFGLVGAWHAFTVNYTIWGVLHGVGLSIVYLLGKKGPAWYKSLRQHLPYKITSCLFTVTFVAVLSTYANTASFSEGIQYAKNLVGL